MKTARPQYTLVDWMLFAHGIAISLVCVRMVQRLSGVRVEGGYVIPPGREPTLIALLIAAAAIGTVVGGWVGKMGNPDGSPVRGALIGLNLSLLVPLMSLLQVYFGQVWRAPPV